MSSRNVLLTVLESGKSEMKVPVDSVSAESLLSGSQRAPHAGSRARELDGISVIRALISSMRAPSSCPKHFPKAPLPNTITLGIRFQHMNLGIGTTQTFSP